MATNIFEQMSVNHGYIFDDSLGLCEKIFSGLEFISNTYYDRPPLKKSDDKVAKTYVLFGKDKNKTVKLGFYLRAHHTKNKIIYKIESAFFKFENKYYVINNFRKSLFDASNECYFYVSVYDSESKKFARLEKKDPNRPVVPDDFKKFDGTDFIIPMNEVAAVRFNPNQEMDVITYAIHLINEEYEKLPKFSQVGNDMSINKSEIVKQILTQCSLDSSSEELLNLIFCNTPSIDGTFRNVVCGKTNNNEMYAVIYLEGEDAVVRPSIILNIGQDPQTSAPKASVLFKYVGQYYLVYLEKSKDNEYYYSTVVFNKVVSVIVDKDIGYEIVDLHDFELSFKSEKIIEPQIIKQIDNQTGESISNIFKRAINDARTTSIKPRTRVAEDKQ